MRKPRQFETNNVVNRATRWDLIRKRHYNATPNTFNKNDAVKRLIEMDFIGNKQRQILMQDHKDERHLNPLVVMDLRHKMCKQMTRSLPLATVQQKKKDDWCKKHNLLVQERQIANELNRLRQQMERQHQRQHLDMPPAAAITHNMDNEVLIESLKKTSQHIEDFYMAPLEALNDMQIILNAAKNKRPIIDDKTPSDVEQNGKLHDQTVIPEEVKAEEKEEEQDQTVRSIHREIQEEVAKFREEENISEQILEFIEEIEYSQYEELNKTTIARDKTNKYEEEKDPPELHVRCVRFEENIEVRKYKLKRENSCSSDDTSDGIDSVISDLAEEALQELREEEEEEKKEAQIQIEKSSTSSLVLNEVSKDNKNNGTKTDAASPPPALIVRRLEVPIFKKSNENQNTTVTTKGDILTDSEEEESISNHEQNQIIEQLFHSHAHTNIAILRKCFLQWIHYTNMEKISRDNMSCKTNRMQQINIFLNKIRMEKSRINNCHNNQNANQSFESNEHNIRDDASEKQQQKVPPPQITKKYQNKIKMQQDIIDLQRIKLERQERIIMELKLHKLSEEAKEAREELKNELKNVIQSGDPKAKAKAKCLQLIGNLRDKQEEEDAARLQGKACFVPKFLMQMQERALERSVKHEQARQRRLQQEAEREAIKMAAEEARRMEDDEVKQQRIEALREKRRQEKMEKIIRERQRQRAVDNHRKSQEFCRLYLLRRVGMEAFKRLLARKRQNQRNSESMRVHIAKRNCFHAWQQYCNQIMADKMLRSRLLHEKIIKRRIVAAWIFYVQQERSKYWVAVDWYELRLAESVFKEWFHHTKRNQLNEITKMRQAISHHEWNTKWKVLDCWQRLSQILQIERETEERRQRWRLKIWELLPDYQPNRNEN